MADVLWRVEYDADLSPRYFTGDGQGMVWSTWKPGTPGRRVWSGGYGGDVVASFVPSADSAMASVETVVLRKRRA